MPDILWHIPISMIGDGIFHTSLGLLWLMTLVALPTLLIYGAFYLLDTWKVVPHKEQAMVIHTRYAHANKTVIHMEGDEAKVSRYADSWMVTAKLPDNRVISCDISKRQLHRLKAGDTVNLNLKTGRISKKPYAISVC